jgi:hypothetical protein
MFIKRALTNLWLDKSLVGKIKKTGIDNGHLYHQVLNGRITLQEYLRAAQPE